MKRLLCILSVMGSVALGGRTAVAADLGVPRYIAPPPPSPVYTWTGFYVGANGGFRWRPVPVSFHRRPARGHLDVEFERIFWRRPSRLQLAVRPGLGSGRRKRLRRREYPGDGVDERQRVLRKCRQQG